MPEARQSRALTERVAALSARLGGTAFIPHVTIQGDITQPLPTLDAAVVAMAAAWPPQHWPVADVDGTDAFFRCLFLRFAETPAYLDCKRRAEAATGSAGGLSMFPHLSLFYGELAPAAKAAVIAELRDLADEPLRFDQIAIARSSSRVAIDDWAVLRRFPFTG